MNQGFCNEQIVDTIMYKNMLIVTWGMNKPSSWGHVMKAPWGNPLCSSGGSLVAMLRRDVTTSEWGRRRRWRMRWMQGRRGRQCLRLSPDSPRCCAGRGNLLDCSGQNHWATESVSVGGSREKQETKHNMGSIT